MSIIIPDKKKKNLAAAIAGGAPNVAAAAEEKKRGAGPGRPAKLVNHKRAAFNLDAGLLEKLKAKADAEAAGNQSYLLNEILRKVL